MKSRFVYLFLLCVLSSCDHISHTPIDFGHIEELMPLHPDSALTLLNQAEDAGSFSLHDKARYYLLQTEAHDKTYTEHTTDSLITIVTDYYEGTDDAERKAKAWYYRGRVNQDLDLPLKAQEYYLRALRDEERIKDYALLGRINNHIGMLYTFQDVYEQALLSQKKAVTYFNAINDTIGQVYTLRDQGRIYQMLEFPDSAITCYLDAIDLMETFNELSVYSELGNLYLEKRNYSQAGLYLAQLKSSLDEMSANGLSDEIDYSFYLTLGDYYNQAGRPDSALHYLGICAKQATRLDTRISTYAILKNMAYEQKDWERYALMDQIYIGVRDSLISQNQMESIRKYQTLYNYQSVQQELALEQSKNMIANLWITVILIIISILIVFLIYRYLKHERERKLLIDLQKETESRNKEQQIAYERQIQGYEEQIALKEQNLQLLEKHIQNQGFEIEKLNMIKADLENDLQSLKKKKHDKKLELNEIAFRNSSIYVRFHEKAAWKPTLADWCDLICDMDFCYPTFALNLNAQLPGLTLSEKRLCYLLKIRVKPTVIAKLLCCSDTNITMSRKRLYKKIFNNDASAKDFDEYIVGL